VKRSDPKMLALQVENWNLKYPVGTEVEYHPVIGEPEHRVRKTRSVAEVLSGHTAVVWLEQERGCVALDACVPVPRKLHTFTDTPCGRALANCENALGRPLGLGEMADFLMDNFMEIANSDEAHQIRDSVLIQDARRANAQQSQPTTDSTTTKGEHHG
jgi:hypothetical protein